MYSVGSKWKLHWHVSNLRYLLLRIERKNKRARTFILARSLCSPKQMLLLASLPSLHLFNFSRTRVFLRVGFFDKATAHRTAGYFSFRHRSRAFWKREQVVRLLAVVFGFEIFVA